MADTGVVLVGVGDTARTHALECLASLRQFPDWPAHIVGDPINAREGVTWYPPFRRDRGARWDKLHLWEVAWREWEYVVYLDADTRILAPLDAGIALLHDGWELVIVPSKNQGEQRFHHIGQEERLYTSYELGYDPVQFQAGVFLIRRTDAIIELFETWKREWLRWQDQDQAALHRALEQTPVRVYLLGRPFNGGPVIQHHFGLFRNGGVPGG